MSIRKLAVLAAVAAFSLLALGSTTASATTALRTDPGNLLLTGATTLKNTTSSAAVLGTQAGTVTCTRTDFDADVTSNSNAGSITGSLTQLTFTTCTDTILAVNISSCHLHRVGGAIPPVTISANGTGGNIALSDVTVRCTTSPTQGCYYTAATANGTGVNATNIIHFPSVPVTAVGNPPGTADGVSAANCGTTGTFSVTLNHIVDSTNRTVTITTA
jgi:hypothetical protein